MRHFAKRLDALEAGRGMQRVVILRQDLDDVTIYRDEDGAGHTEEGIAVMAQDTDLLIIRIEYVEDWPVHDPVDP